MHTYQLKGHVILPVFISFLIIQTVTSWVSILSGGKVSLIVAILYSLFLIGVHLWFKQKEVYNLLIGFDSPNLAISLSLYLTLLVGLIYICNWLEPEFYHNISNALLLSLIGIGFIFFYIVKEKLPTSHTFVALAPDRYMDLAYRRIHTKDDIMNYTGERILIEGLHIDNLILMGKFAKKKKLPNVDVKIEKGNGFLNIIYYKEGKKIWEETYKCSEKEYNIEDIVELVKNIY